MNDRSTENENKILTVSASLYLKDVAIKYLFEKNDNFLKLFHNKYAVLQNFVCETIWKYYNNDNRVFI